MARSQLDDPLKDVVGKAAPVLARARGLRTVGDLLDWLPRVYLDPARPSDYGELPLGEPVVILGTVRGAQVHRMRNRKGSRLVVDVVDENDRVVQLTFFRTYGHTDRLTPGTRVVCSGTLSSYHQQLQLTHPEYAVLRDGPGGGSGQWLLGGLVPVYTVTKGLSPITHGDCVDLALHHLTELGDPLPAAVREQHGLPSLLESYRMVHRPTTEAEHRRARWRLTFQEAFVVQAALARARHASDAVPATPRVAAPGGLVDALLERLPFELTDGQREVLAEIRADLARPVPMHRLLQGEVGSGKTVLALLAMLTVVDAGGQAALLAPTEVLAAQHHRSISALLGPLAEGGTLLGDERGTRVALLTGSQTAAERRAMLLQAAGGEAGIVVGTHALIQDGVQLADLGLVVVDEQHRFGVEQRDALRAKAKDAPHVLVMTATPIPRTVAMTVYGDMTTSTLRELPRGRQPITTHVVTGDRPGWVQRMWERVAEEVRSGGQVYVVCPRIGDEDDPDLPEGTTLGPGVPVRWPGPGEGELPAGGPEVERPEPRLGRGKGHLSLVLLEEELPPAEEGSATAPLHGVLQVERALRGLPATRDLAIGLLHGRMATEEKDATMQRFAAGALDVLVATTVIEVGVDVPDATTMVVLDAGRFGISQLHQLRGRVGRGGRPGLCLLVTQGEEGGDEAVERLQQVAATTDGFELARLDLSTRREGDVLGASQSGGRSGLRFLRLVRDEELIVAAHEAAWATVEADPDLADHPHLAAALDRMDAERAAFLERG